MPNPQHTSLINRAKDYFKDSTHKVWLYPCQRFYTKQGFSYLVLDKENRKSISCAIHYGREFVVTEEIGRIHTTNIDLSTNEAIDIQNSVLVYENADIQSILSSGVTSAQKRDMYIFLKSFEGFNETFSFYAYNGEALTCDKDSALHEISGVYGWSVFDKLQDLEGYTILPFFANAESTTDKAIFCKIQDQQSLSMLDNTRGTLMRDSVKFTMLHYTRQECLKFIDTMQNACANKMVDFGIMSNISVKELDDLQESAGLRGLANSIECDLSYLLKPIDSSELESRNMKKIYFTLKGVV